MTRERKERDMDLKRQKVRGKERGGGMMDLQKRKRERGRKEKRETAREEAERKMGAVRSEERRVGNE